MRGNMNGYASSYYNPRDSYDTYDTYSTYNSYTTREPRRSAAPPRHRTSARRPTWPPSPAVEDESDAAQKEVPSVVGSDEGEPPINTRGSVDQESLLDEIEQPKQPAGDDRRFNNTSEASDNGLNTTPNGHEARRRSVAERGNMPHLNTHVDTDPIMFAKRVSTPYSYTPQKDSHAPAPANFMLSPEPMTPAGTSRHGTTTSRDDREAQRDRNARPSRTVSGHARRDSFDGSAPRSARNAVFDDDTASEGEDMAHLRINERKPARYSFVKSDSQKEDSRADLHKSQPRSEAPRQDSKQRSPPARSAYEYPSRPSKESSYDQSPRSSASSVNSEKRRSRLNPVDTAYANSPRDPSRPSSPVHRVPSPKLPPRLRESPPASRPSSRGNAAKPQSPLAWSTTFQPPSPRQVPITDADWHSTYPPTNAYDRSRPPSRLSRHETIQVPPPRVDIQSPSPVRPANPLPYPVEDHHAAVWMPPEEHYQFDHSSVSSPRQQQVFRDVPRVASPSIPSSPRQSDVYREARSARPRTPRADEALRPRRSRSNSADSKHSLDSSRTKHSSTTSRAKAQTLIERPLPACPRSAPTDRHDDWYSFPGYRNFDVCPACFDAVFVDTPFAGCFKQMRRYERPTERFCDFSSPWVRLAWLLTIKQRRADLGLLYALADVNDTERPCPAHRELSADRVAWYGLLDPREGVHVAGFAVCAADVKNLEILFPSVKGYFTPLPSSIYATPEKHTCSLRTASTRFLAYLDLLVDLDAEAQSTATHADMSPFLKLARANAFKGECARDKPLHRKPWHFIPSLPEFTVCEECFAEVIWPAVAAQSSALAQRVNKSIQLVPNEDPEVGSSCVLYSKRMRRVWDVSCAEEDIKYLERKVLERRRKEVILGRERRGVLAWMSGVEKGGRQWERAREELRLLEREWGEWE
ncbi:hypothetical protein G6514_001160 [Epicoccum nigrum]|nr:hypothetical protein G6514_001160 [Epicoccum nigrum]